MRMSKGVLTPHRMPGDYAFGIDALENSPYLGRATFYTESNMSVIPEVVGLACEQFDAFKLKKRKPKAGGTEAYAERLGSFFERTSKVEVPPGWSKAVFDGLVKAETDCYHR